MTRDEWEKIEELFHEARAIEAEKRSAFLDEACASDAGLRLYLERLLAENPDADSLLGKPAIDFVSAMVSTAPQTIPSGTLLQHYRILGTLGAGSMGTVYRARDLKLGRDVAIKVLPPAFTADSERLTRFKREARVLASLNHPNLGAIYGLEEGEGTRALILELIEGPTLADRLQKGPIPAGEALAIALQVVDGLDAAHGSGVVHRDLKPANIKVRADGTVKVVDFGIAKANTHDASAGELTTLPTASIESTQQGMILGTPAYMSPEQARGQTVDKRADIWAFGCVLYEMLTGQRAFAGATVTDVFAAILEREPDWQLWPAATPPNVIRLVRRCLEKDPRKRLRDIADARSELTEPDGAIAVTVPQPARSRWRTVLLVAAAATILVVGTWGLTRPPTPPPQPRPVGRFQISIAPAVNYGRPPITNLTVSPNGRLVVFGAASPRADGSEGERMLYLRPIDQLDAKPIRGTERGSNPVFSPDGTAVAFLGRGGKLMRVRFDDAKPVELASVSTYGSSVGLSWFSNEDVLFADYGRGLSRTQPNGKEPIEVTKLDPKKPERHLFPVVLPGDQTILFTVVPPTGFVDAQIVAQPLSGGPRQVLVNGGADARFITPGYLVYMRSDTLMAARFDPSTLAIGQEVPMLEGVRVSLTSETSGTETSAGQFAVSASGHMVYLGGSARPDPVSTLEWIDRNGTAEPINAPTLLYRSPRLDPEGNRVAFITQRGFARDIYIYNFSERLLSRQTFKYENTSPIWSPDGARVAFSSTENSLRNLFWNLVDGKTGPEPLTTSVAEAQDPMSWYGNYLLFTQRHERRERGTGRRTIMLLKVGEKQPPTAWLEPQGNYEFRYPQFSRDGRYVAYGSNESGKWEVYVRPFQGDGPRVQVSKDGGHEPAWSRSGELFYRNAGKVIAVDLSTTPVLAVLRRTPLFDDIYETANPRPNRNYDVTADGTRFLMVKKNPEGPEPRATYINIVTNWIEEVEKELSKPVK
ncbi:MAG TPA: protein kinase [Terriglobia bacterium]|nr:protein kinase [Terriglobia bacterium]